MIVFALFAPDDSTLLNGAYWLDKDLRIVAAVGTVILLIYIYTQIPKSKLPKYEKPEPSSWHLVDRALVKPAAEPNLMPVQYHWFTLPRLVVVELPCSFATVMQVYPILHVRNSSIQELEKMVGDRTGAAILLAIAKKNIVGLSQVGHTLTAVYVLGNSLTDEVSMRNDVLDAIRSVVWRNLPKIELSVPYDITNYGRSDYLDTTGLTPQIMGLLSQAISRQLPPGPEDPSASTN